MAIERRLYPRFPLTCEVRVTLPEAGGEFIAEATHLSRSSIQLNCTPALFTALLKQQRLPYSCGLEFKLPWHKRLFRSEAYMVTHRRLSQMQYVLVLRLPDEDGDQAVWMESLLQQHASPGQE